MSTRASLVHERPQVPPAPVPVRAVLHLKSASSRNDVERSSREVPGIVREVLRSPGRRLDPGTRSTMEARFRHDFSRVRVHVNGKAAQSATAIDALAYTVGQDIVWGPQPYSPESALGQRLLAHELAHTLQQSATPADASNLVIAPNGGAAEREADRVAAAVVSGRDAVSSAGEKSALLQRSPAERRAGDALRRGSTLPYREAHNLTECTRIMGSENLEYCQREVLGDHVADAPLGVRAQRVLQDLRDLIAGATWKEIRKRVYPKESEAGVARAKERKAGTRPDLTGLGRIGSLEKFVSAIRKVQTDWAPLSADDRVKEIGGVANVALKDAEVPGFLVVDKQVMEFKGSFSSHLWSFTISEALVTGSALSDKDAAEVANTTLHEGRHAEQQFLAARFAAGVLGQGAAAIRASQGIPAVIADEGVRKKFDARTDPAVAALGRNMFAAKVTHGPANQAISDDDGLADLAVRKAEADTALRSLSGAVTPPAFADAVAKRNALRAQIITVEEKYKLYRNIPYESDAHEVGDAAELAFNKWR